MRPHTCYCRIPQDKLVYLTKKHFIEGVPTEELMAQLEDEKDREYLAAIALADLRPEDLPKVVPDDPVLVQHLFDCRGHVTEILEAAGLHLEERTLQISVKE